jgi:acyl-CoA thioester hydrolase
MDLQQLPVTHRAKIPASYMDEMGHMNVMWYTHLFSEATGGLFDLLGLTRDYFEKNQAGSFALENHIRYRKEIRTGESISVRTRMLGRSEKRFHMMHFIVKEPSGDLAATGEFIGTHVDMKTRRTSPVPPQISALVDRLLAEHAQLNWEAPVCGVMKP